MLRKLLKKYKSKNFSTFTKKSKKFNLKEFFQEKKDLVTTYIKKEEEKM
jgi:hypothetical protein